MHLYNLNYIQIIRLAEKKFKEYFSFLLANDYLW